MAMKRKIPTILIDQGRAVKTIEFGRKIYLGDPVNIAKIFSDLGADEIIYLDISKDRFNKEPDYGLLRRIARQCSMPMTYGGGICNTKQAKAILALGIEKISTQTYTFQNGSFLAELAHEIGVQSTLLSVDVRDAHNGQNYEVFDRANKQYIALDHFIENLSNPDVGEVIVTHMGRDGMKTGPDLNLIKMLRNHIKQPMIYSGGVFEDRCFDAAFAAGADAVAASSHFVLKGTEKSILISYPKPSWQL